MSDVIIVPAPPPTPSIAQPTDTPAIPPAMSERSDSKPRSVAPVSSSSKRSTHEAANGTTTTADNTTTTVEPVPETSGEKADETDVMQVDDAAAEPVPATDVTAGVAGASVSGEQDELEAADEEAPANGQTAATAATVDGENDDDIHIVENEDGGKNGKSVDGDDDGDAESGLDEGEYEIEAILDNKRLTGKGKAGYEYLVSWVGYGPEFNEWVGEENFGSHEMIDNYWSKLGGKPNKGPQKRGATSATGSKRRRAEDSPTGNGAGPSKRGRRNNAVPAVTDQEEDPEADELSAFSKDHKESMAPYADYASWEEHVKSIETIERGANDKLVVYMIMKGGEKTAQDAETCNGRCPQKMLKFYERHLKWRQTK